jgi:hypothetical protein
MKRLFQHKLLVGGVALLAAGGAGGAYAATQSRTDSRQALLGDVAKRLHVSPSQLRSAIRGALLDRLGAAVKAGRLTQAQANHIKQRLEQGGGLPLGPMWRHELAPARHSLLPTAASYLNLSPDQLFGDLRGGKTLAQVAQAKNKSVSGLEQALMTAAKARLARLVSSGVLTKAQEQRRLNRLNDRIARLVNAHPGFLRPVGEGPPPPAPALGPPPPPPGA